MSRLTASRGKRDPAALGEELAHFLLVAARQGGAQRCALPTLAGQIA